MSGFAAWGLTILGLAVVTTIAEMLLPKGKTRKAICSVAATVAVLVIVTPIPKLLKNGFDIDFGGDTDVVVDGDYVDYVDGIKADLIGESAVQYVASKGYTEKIRVSVELDGWDVKSARVNFVDFGMTDGDAHIHKSEIIKLVADYFGIGEEAVMSYG